MTPTTFDFEMKNQVGHVILNRPDRLNALTFESYAELRDFFAHLRQRTDVRMRLCSVAKDAPSVQVVMLKILSVNFLPGI